MRRRDAERGSGGRGSDEDEADDEDDDHDDDDEEELPHQFLFLLFFGMSLNEPVSHVRCCGLPVE